MPHRHCALLFVMFALIAAGLCEEPINVSICQLKQDPFAYNHKLVRITGFVSHAFEDFTIRDPSCHSWPEIWLEYGGKAKSGTMYCCGVTADRSRPKELKIEGFDVPLVLDEEFRKFDTAIQPPFRSGGHGAVIRATLIGRFFAGKKITFPKSEFWGGFGHMGCCTLLAIQKIESADSENHPELDYGASPDQPDMNKVACGFRFLLPFEQSKAVLKWQQEVEQGQHSWALDDPKRVATDSLSKLAKIDVALLESIKLTHDSQGRKVYSWDSDDKSTSYLIVVSRPYWLSFYATNPDRVSWVPIAAYESSCRKKNSVTRIK